MKDLVMSAVTVYALVLAVGALIFGFIGYQASIHADEVRKRTPPLD